MDSSTKLPFKEEMDRLAYAWPPEAIKEQLLKEQRRRCEWCLKKIAEIELLNREERARGVSYKDRLKHSRSIEILKRMFAENKDKGLLYQRQATTVYEWVKDELDVEFIHSRGFENHLNYSTI